MLANDNIRPNSSLQILLQKVLPCSCGEENEPLYRIVGGSETSINGFPWHVGIKAKKKKHPHCGGTMIGQKHILTAAHCFFHPLTGKNIFGLDNLNILMGEHDWSSGSETNHSQLITIEAIFVHPLYNKKTRELQLKIL